MNPGDIITHPFRPEAAQMPALSVSPMQIVAGTDFSRHAAQAAEAAAAFATMLHEPLRLVHAIDEQARAQLPAQLREPLRTFAQQQLRDEAQRLRSRTAAVREEICEGAAADILARFASGPDTRLLALSSRRTASRLAERLAQASAVPTLIVRAAEPFIAWARGKRSLRVLVAADFSRIADAALGWVRWLRTLGPCVTTVACLEPGIPESSPAEMALLVRTAEVQARCFRQRVRRLLGPGRVRVRIEEGWGQSDAHLIQMACEERADLIVISTHSSRGLELGQPSVSRGVVRYAPMSVACIPA